MDIHQKEHLGTIILEQLAFAARLEASKITYDRQPAALRLKKKMKKLCTGYLRAALSPTVEF